MKLNQRIHEYLHRDDGELIASFGDARLVKYLHGKFELRGGTDADRAQAREWCSLFLHGAVFTSSSLRVHATATPHSPPPRALIPLSRQCEGGPEEWI